jgi:hypothetical protein
MADFDQMCEMGRIVSGYKKANTDRDCLSGKKFEN